MGEVNWLCRVVGVLLPLLAAAQEPPLLPGPPIWARLRDAVSSKTAKAGDLVFAAADAGSLPPGSWAVLRVERVQSPGVLYGRAGICLKLERLQLPGGRVIGGDAATLQAVGSSQLDPGGCLGGAASANRDVMRILKPILIVGGITGGAVAALNSVNTGSLKVEDKRKIRDGAAIGGAALGSGLVLRAVLKRGEHFQLPAGEQVQILLRSAEALKGEAPPGGETWKPPMGTPEKR